MAFVLHKSTNNWYNFENIFSQKIVHEPYCNKAKVFNGTVVGDETTDFDQDTLYIEIKSLALE